MGHVALKGNNANLEALRWCTKHQHPQDDPSIPGYLTALEIRLSNHQPSGQGCQSTNLTQQHVKQVKQPHQTR